MNATEIITKINETNLSNPFWIRVLKLYNRSQNSRAAKEAGIIGVGLITFAEHRVDVFIRRCGR